MSGARTVQEGRVNMATLATTSTSRLVFLRSRKVTFYTHYPYTLHFLPQSPVTSFSAKPAAPGSQSAEREQETIPSFLSLPTMPRMSLKHLTFYPALVVVISGIAFTWDTI